MSVTINIRTNFPDVAAQLKTLQKDIGDKAMVRALNATIVQGKSEMARTISKEYRINVRDARDRLGIERARKKGAIKLEAILHATRRWRARGMNLIHFVMGARARAKQLQFQIKRSGGRKSIPGAFVATNRKTGGRAVFIREDDGKYITGRKNIKGDSKHAQAIAPLTTIDVPRMFNSRRVNDVVRKVMLERFGKNFNRELRAVLRGFAK